MLMTSWGVDLGGLAGGGRMGQLERVTLDFIHCVTLGHQSLRARCVSGKSLTAVALLATLLYAKPGLPYMFTLLLTILTIL